MERASKALLNLTAHVLAGMAQRTAMHRKLISAIPAPRASRSYARYGVGLAKPALYATEADRERAKTRYRRWSRNQLNPFRRPPKQIPRHIIDNAGTAVA